MPPKKKAINYGRDDVHGRSGPEYTDPGDGFAENTGYEGSGYPLEYFRGQWVDRLSKQEILDDEAAEEEVRQFEHDQSCLSELGFGTDGTTLQ